MRLTVNRLFAWGGSLLAACAVAAGLYFSGSPAEQRMLRFDQQRVRDLSMLAAHIDAYWSANGAFPADLDTLLEAQRLRMPLDPETRRLYEYEVLSDDAYRLCATFARSSQDVSVPDFWAHEAGRQCFTMAPQTRVPALIPRTGVVLDPSSGR